MIPHLCLRSTLSGGTALAAYPQILCVSSSSLHYIVFKVRVPFLFGTVYILTKIGVWHNSSFPYYHLNSVYIHCYLILFLYFNLFLILSLVFSFFLRFLFCIFFASNWFFNNIVHRAGQFAAIPRPLTADYILSKVNIMFAHFTITKKRRGCVSLGCRKSGIMPLFRGLHGSLVPAARPGIHEKKPLPRKAFADLLH